MDLRQKNNNYLSIFLLFALCILADAAVCIFLGGYDGWDIKGHWSICAYTLRGYNPYLLIGAEKGPFPDIIGIPENFSTVPWGCLLGSAYYAGFLPLTGACVYNFIMHFVFAFLTVLVIYKTFAEFVGTKRSVVLSALLIVSHFSFMYSVYYGNAGGIICSMLIISIFLAKSNPYISGILLSLTMSKPQIAAIICIIYVFEGRWKAIITAALIDIAAWLAVSLMTDTGIVDLLIQTFSSGTASPVQYLGLFSVIKHMGVEKGIVLMMNVFAGVTYTIGLWYYLKKKSDSAVNQLVFYVPACIASTFWIYKNGTDYMILAFAVIFFAVLFLNNKMSLRDRIVSWICMGYLLMSRCAVYIGIIVSGENQVAIDFVKSLDGLLIAVSGIIFCRMWTKYNSKIN